MSKSNNHTTHLPRIAALAVAGVFAATMSGAASAGCNTEGTTGEVCLMAATFCPAGTMETNGQTLEIINHQALFSLLGTTYGGDGVRTFNLPDLRGRVPVGVGTGNHLATVAQGQQRGEEYVQLPQGGNAIAVARTGDKLPVAAPKEVSVLNPQLGMRYCIVTNGMFPARP